MRVGRKRVQSSGACLPASVLILGEWSVPSAGTTGSIFGERVPMQRMHCMPAAAPRQAPEVLLCPARNVQNKLKPWLGYTDRVSGCVGTDYVALGCTPSSLHGSKTCIQLQHSIYTSFLA